MQKRYEKVIYINDLGQRVEIAYSFPFFLQSINGIDGIDAEISRIKSMGQDGTTTVDTTLSERPIRLIGSIRGDTKDIVENYRLRLLRVFNPKIRGWLHYEYGSLKRKIRCNIEKAPVFNKRIKSFKYQDFLIDFLCPNPFWQDISESKAEVALWRGAFHFPLIIPGKEPIIMGYREPSLIVNVINHGNVETGMRIKFKARGVVENPSLFNVNTREFIKINKEMESGEVITINTNRGNKKVTSTINGVTENILNYIDVVGGGNTFLQLDSGDNLLRYDADDGIDNLEVDIYYHNNYLGV